MLFFEVAGIIALIQCIFAFIAIRLITDKFTDLAYGGTFVIVMLYLFPQIDSFLHYLLFLVILLRGIRLAGYLFMRILLIKKDERFDGIRENKKSFAQFWILQAVIIFFLLSGPVVIFTKSDLSIGLVSILGLIIALGGLTLETIADHQKFQAKRQEPTRRVDRGLRSKARHPNYFGEMLMRWGVFIMILPALGGWEYLTIIGPFSISWLLLFVTGIPPLEQQREKKYGENGDYQYWKKNTNLLIPWK